MQDHSRSVRDSKETTESFIFKVQKQNVLKTAQSFNQKN